MPNLRQRLPPMATLVAFEASARLGSFTRAAAELNLTQAAVSRQIRIMEDNMQSRLFERRRHDVSLTESGQRLAASVSVSLRSIAETADAIRNAPAGDNGVTVFCEMALASHRLIPRLDAFSHQHPDVQLKILTSNQSLETVGEPVDVGLQFGKRDSKRFETIDICGDTVFAISAPALLDQIDGPISIQTFNRLRLLHLEQPWQDWMDWPKFLAAHGAVFDPKPGDLVFDTYSSLIEAVIAGSGIALGWGLTIENRLKEGLLVKVGDMMLPAPERFYAHVPKSKRRSPAVNKFIAWLKEELASTS